jgi:RecJ-like exonuclease
MLLCRRCLGTGKMRTHGYILSTCDLCDGTGYPKEPKVKPIVKKVKKSQKVNHEKE